MPILLIGNTHLLVGLDQTSDAESPQTAWFIRGNRIISMAIEMIERQDAIYRQMWLEEFAARPRFALEPLKPGEGWYIVATHPSGQREHIAGFHDAREAQDWLANSVGLRAWLKTRGYVHCR